MVPRDSKLPETNDTKKCQPTLSHTSTQPLHKSTTMKRQHLNPHSTTSGGGGPPIKASRGRGGSKHTHSRSYPRGVGLDFRKLAGLTLMSYIDHHGE